MEPEILETLDARLDPAHTALIIIDMQKDFCCDGFATSRAGRPLDAAKSIIPILAAFREAARDAGVLVVHVGFETYIDHMSDSGPWLTQRRRSSYASDKIALTGDEGMEFIPELSPEKGELTVRKHRYSAFKGTDLDMLLRAHNIRTVVPCGVSTNVCVESTFRDAFEHSYYICVPQDGCASWDMELHTATLKTANARFGLVVTVEKITQTWRNRTEKATIAS
ncbi:MAG: isochorismatase family cysteine hydrolase [Arenicellales bacterium]|jgi:ureidoacrylate peracid hydrolase